MTDLYPYFKNGEPLKSVMGETYVVKTVGEPAQIILPPGKTLNGKPGPFTVTNF